MSAEKEREVVAEPPAAALTSSIPTEFGKAMRQIHSGELTALSQRTSIRELRSVSGLIIKIDEPGSR